MYEEIEQSLFKQKDQFCVLEKYFIRGAECVLSENMCTTLGIAKGTTGTMQGLV